MENIEISFEYKGFEFYVYQSKIDATDEKWYIWSPSRHSTDDRLGIVPDPFKDRAEFEDVALAICDSFINNYEI